jgi:hypothetical protein
MLTELTKNIIDYQGIKGLPENYPTPCNNDLLLFYIQRNLNTNTVIYELNKNSAGQIDENSPIKIYWIKYSEGGFKKSLNYIQTQLAYGYTSEKISSYLYEFYIVSYNKIKFYLDVSDDYPKVFTRMDNELVLLSNIYVYADEVGVFPEVRYVEIYGSSKETNLPVYQKITF